MGRMLKVVRVGDVVDVVLPQDVLDRLQAELGDSLSLDEADTGFVLSKSGKELNDIMAVARSIMDRDREILRALAQ